MEDLQDLIKFLKDNGLKNHKINIDLLFGIIEYFADKQQPKQCNIAVISNCAYLVQDKNTLINHGLFSSEEKANKYINGSSKYAVQKYDIA